MECLAKFLLYRETKGKEEIQKYTLAVKDIARTDVLYEMDRFVQHSNVSCLEHSIYVSFEAFKLANILRLDAEAVARGALLHDFFLYDWHETRPPEGLHGFVHPGIALRNAKEYFQLSSREVDIIEKHMWPLTWKRPRHAESILVNVVDKTCSAMEIFRWGHLKRQKKLLAMKERLRKL